jgi:hypothetical protein
LLKIANQMQPELEQKRGMWDNLPIALWAGVAAFASVAVSVSAATAAPEEDLSALTDWISAIGAVGGGVGTVGAVIVALQLARNQGRQTGEQAQRRQAERVTAWFVPYHGPQDHPHRVYLGLRLQNSSEELIYDLVAQVVGAQGSFRKTAVGDSGERNMEFGALVGNVPPGWRESRINCGGHGMMVRHAIELAFQDAAGRYWLRHGNGRLEQVDKHPLDLYDISRPVGWQN